MYSDDNQTVSSTSKSSIGWHEALVWSHFYKNELDKSRGHFQVTCNYCEKQWNCDTSDILENYLANKYIYCFNEVQNEYLEVVANRKVEEFQKKKLKKIKLDFKQTLLSDFMESTKLSDTRRNSINTALGRFFITCSIPFSVANYSFFIEFCKQLRPAYDPPSRTTISTNILYSEAATITLQIQKELQSEENITMALDG